MKKTLFFLLSMAPIIIYGQIEITEEAVPIEEEFEWFLGNGFTPDEIITGTMNSDVVSTESNIIDPNVDFGDYITTGEFARGVSTGGTSIEGGIYAFNTGNSNIAFGVKPSSDYYTPGNIIVKIQNKTPGIPNDPIDIVFTSLQVSFDIWYKNTTDNTTTVDLLVSSDNMSYTSTDGVNGHAFTTPGTAGTTWQKVTQHYVLTNDLNGISIPRNELYYLKFGITTSNEMADCDEIAIDNFKVIANPSVIFTEILQKPTTIDANDDGVTVEFQDEFIEMIAYDKTDVIDIAGWKIFINGMIRHIFPAGSGLVPDQAAVIFGGGTPLGDFGGGPTTNSINWLFRYS